jgi:3'-phosphoadenosine 5'-phosphosulfate sulfotransferase (PAPS reductase)/FAD synthetase
MTVIKKILPICSVSGGKDSTALYLLMMEYHGNDFLPIFADTGHEHPVTVNYVKNLHLMTGGPQVQIVKADFTRPLAKRRKKIIDRLFVLRFLFSFLPDAWDLWSEYNRLLKQARNTRPRGNPFLDMMIWKGRAPSTKAQFCTEHLKLWPIMFFLQKHYPPDQYEWVSHTGIRGAESKRRAGKQPFSWNDFFDCAQVLPLLYESEEFVFEYLKQRGVPPNPLYALGYGRVGCFPCIHAIKTELELLPDWAWEKLEYWENILGRTWFPPGLIPDFDGLHTIAQVRDWCLTSRGGRQFNLFKSGEKADSPSCMSEWICE